MTGVFHVLRGDGRGGVEMGEEEVGLDRYIQHDVGGAFSQMTIAIPMDILSAGKGRGDDKYG